MIFNRKGDMPTILLFVIALVLVVTSLSVFVSFKADYIKESEERDSILTTISFYESYLKKEIEIVGRETIKSGGGKEEFQKLIKERDMGIVELKSFFDRIDKGDFYFQKDREKYFFEMRDFAIGAFGGANSLRREFGIRVEFDKIPETASL